MNIGLEEFKEALRMFAEGRFDTNDVYRAVAAHVLRVPTRDVTDDQRQEVKNKCYQWMYGFDGDKPQNMKDDFFRIMEIFKRNYPQVQEWARVLRAVYFAARRHDQQPAALLDMLQEDINKGTYDA